jgi:hypothetical protein
MEVSIMINVNDVKWIHVKDALYNMHEDSGAPADYGRGILMGIVVMIMAVFQVGQPTAFCEAMKHFPRNFRIRCIPSSWLELNPGEIQAHNWTDVVTFAKLVDDLPEKEADAVKDDLLDKYLYLIGAMVRYARDVKNVSLVMNTWRHAGSQHIAEFEVKDLGKPVDANQFNFHGQNTSQWLFAGALCVQNGRVSMHT